MPRKKKTLREIETALPGISSEKVEIISDELDRVLSLKDLFQSDGGRELINLLRNNCVKALNQMIVRAKEGGKDADLVGLVSYYSANIDLLSQLREVSMEQELRDQLDEAVKDAMEQ